MTPVTLRSPAFPLIISLFCGLAAARPLLVSAGGHRKPAPQPVVQKRAPFPGAGKALARVKLAPKRRLWASLAPLPDQSASPAPVALRGEDSTDTATDMDEVLHLLQNRYYGTTPSRNTLKYSAVRGMVNSLGDRYTRFLDPDQFRRMQEENSGEFGGISTG